MIFDRGPTLFGWAVETLAMVYMRTDVPTTKVAAFGVARL